MNLSAPTAENAGTQDSGLRTVAVTGLGVVSPVGIGREQFWSALCAGESGIKPFTAAPGKLPTIAASVADFSFREFTTSPQLRRADRLSRTIVTASRLAMRDAGIEDAGVALERMGVVVGSALGSISEAAQYLARLFTKGPPFASPMMFPNLVLNAPASYASMELGCTGANLTVSQGEVSGEQAIALGYDLIRSGRADVVLAGGGDELADVLISAYRTFKALSSQRGGREWSSPYDVDRNGIVPGEGAAMLVLESAQRARRRGARIYAEMADYLSFGVAGPRYDWPERAPAAPARLHDFLTHSLPAGARIDLVCGAANSSRRLDACELDVLTRLFGEAAATVAVTSMKGAIGEFGAAGALTAVAACLAVHHGVVPPLCNLRQAPAGVPFQFAKQTALRRPVNHALQFSIARGGSTLALLFGRTGTS